MNSGTITGGRIKFKYMKVQSCDHSKNSCEETGPIDLYFLELDNNLRFFYENDTQTFYTGPRNINYLL